MYFLEMNDSISLDIFSRQSDYMHIQTHEYIQTQTHGTHKDTYENLFSTSILKLKFKKILIIIVRVSIDIYLTSE